MLLLVSLISTYNHLLYFTGFCIGSIPKIDTKTYKRELFSGFITNSLYSIWSKVLWNLRSKTTPSIILTVFQFPFRILCRLSDEPHRSFGPKSNSRQSDDSQFHKRRRRPIPSRVRPAARWQRRWLVLTNKRQWWWLASDLLWRNVYSWWSWNTGRQRWRWMGHSL